MYVDIYRKPLKQISDENENSLIYKTTYNSLFNDEE